MKTRPRYLKKPVKSAYIENSSQKKESWWIHLCCLWSHDNQGTFFFLGKKPQPLLALNNYHLLPSASALEIVLVVTLRVILNHGVIWHHTRASKVLHYGPLLVFSLLRYGAARKLRICCLNAELERVLCNKELQHELITYRIKNDAQCRRRERGDAVSSGLEFTGGHWNSVFWD